MYTFYYTFYNLYTVYNLYTSSTVGGGDVDGADDIHLILEYKTGEKWGSYEAPRANR